MELGGPHPEGDAWAGIRKSKQAFAHGHVREEGSSREQVMQILDLR